MKKLINSVVTSVRNDVHRYYGEELKNAREGRSHFKNLMWGVILVLGYFFVTSQLVYYFVSMYVMEHGDLGIFWGIWGFALYGIVTYGSAFLYIGVVNLRVFWTLSHQKPTIAS